MLLQAGSGGGKSWAIRRILEQSFTSIPHIILDTEGEFSSLREKYDYILIGKGLDITADPKTAAMLALRLWQERVSAIIDLYELSPWDRQAFVQHFVDAMVNAPKNIWKPVLLVIDEAHEYAPESDKSASGRALHLLASKGRKRQIGALFATQRISSLSKNIVASCKNKLIGYASETNDVKRAAFELGFTPAEARGLRDLDPGEFYVFGPALTKEVTKIRIGPVQTSHEQSSGGGIGRVAPASAKVKKALAKLADLPQEAAEEARTTKELKEALVVSQRRIRELEKAPKTVTIPGPIMKGLTEKEVDARLRSALHKRDLEWEKVVKGWVGYAQKVRGFLIDAYNKLTIDKLIEPPVLPPFTLTPSNLEQATVILKNQHPKKGERMNFQIPNGKTERRLENAASTPYTDEAMKMGAGERQVLIAIAQHGDAGMTREHITVQTGYKRSTRDAYIQRLIQKGHLSAYAGNKFIASESALEALGDDYEPLPTGYALLNYHLQKLPQGEAKVLDYLVNFANGRSDGRAPTRDEISDFTGFKRSTRDAYIQRLATRQLVIVEGQTIRISEHLL